MPNTVTNLPLSGLTIMINPGHGGEIKQRKSNTTLVDVGFVVKANKQTIYESDLNDIVADKVRVKFEKLGAKVVYADNMEKYDVQALENKVKPDLFISIHHDKIDPSCFSSETVLANSKNSKIAAEYINQKFKDDKSISNHTDMSNLAKKLVVLKADENIPAVLVEVGNVNCPNDLKYLLSDDYQEKEADFIVEGSKDFFDKSDLGRQLKHNAEEKMTKEKLNLLKPKWDFKLDSQCKAPSIFLPR